jgi:uncharacterized surface protein with fasciclin (FAS1) repeats
MRYAVKTAMLALAAGLAAAPAANAKNLVEVAQDNGSFGTLLTAAKAAGLVGALSGPGKKTLFAPTDEAFARLPKGTVANLLKPQNKAKLKALLLYHVVGKQVLAKNIPTGTTHVSTLNGANLNVRKGSGGVRVNTATVTTADVRADNGVIHVINRVLMPH